MINSVVTPPVKTSIFYYNDLHGRLGNTARVYNMSNAYDTQNLPDTDKLKFASGDIMLGADEHLNGCMNMFMNATGISATALGNHEFDQDPDQLARTTQQAKFKLLGINLHVPKGNPLENKIATSFIEEKNGNKYGIIGIAPPDLHERIRDGASRDQVKVDDLGKTIKDIQAEITNLKSQGVNKIILLSHAGLETDRKIAQETDGLDVIMGAHTHELVEGIKDGENLLYSKSGEPVIITQAGKDGEYTGILNLEFDVDGIIKKAQNNVTASKKFNRNLVLRNSFNKIMGLTEKIGEIKSAPPPVNDRRIDPNPHMYLFMDAVRSEMPVDLAIINASNIRGYFEPGPIDAGHIFEIVPMKNELVVHKLNEVELVEAFKRGAASYAHPAHQPGIIIPSGLKYTISRSGELKSMTYTDKQGKETVIDVKNPSKDKIYTVASDNFVAGGGDGLFPNKIKSGEYDKIYNFDKTKPTCDYIKKLNKPIEIVDDGRITIVD